MYITLNKELTVPVVSIDYGYMDGLWQFHSGLDESAPLLDNIPETITSIDIYGSDDKLISALTTTWRLDTYQFSINEIDEVLNGTLNFLGVPTSMTEDE